MDITTGQPLWGTAASGCAGSALFAAIQLGALPGIVYSCANFVHVISVNNESRLYSWTGPAEIGYLLTINSTVFVAIRGGGIYMWNPLESTQPTEILAPPPHTDLKNRPRNLPILQAMAIDSDGSLIFAPKFGTGTFSSLGQCAGPHKHGWHVLNIALIAAGSALVLVTLLAWALG